MAKLYNPTYANQMFGNAFTSTFLQTQKLAQEESQFSRDLNFQNRQLQLGEAFRRDELMETARYHGMLGEYYDEQIRQGDESARIRINEGKANLFMQGWKPVEGVAPESNVPIQEIYGQSWIAPPIEQSRWTPGAFGTSIEEKFISDPITGKETTTNFETVISPPTDSGGEGSSKPNQFDTFYNEGLSYLQEIKAINEVGGIEKNTIQYSDARQKATFNTQQAIDLAFANTGVNTKALLESLRANIKGKESEDPIERRAILNEAINRLNQQYELTSEQLKALKLWSEVGTR